MHSLFALKQVCARLQGAWYIRYSASAGTGGGFTDLPVIGEFKYEKWIKLKVESGLIELK